MNGRRLLLHRLYADGAVKVDMPSALAVPKSAVIETGPEAVAYLDQGGGAYARTVVKIGRRGDKVLEVLSGLKEGDKVVTNGNLPHRRPGGDEPLLHVARGAAETQRTTRRADF